MALIWLDQLNKGKVVGVNTTDGSAVFTLVSKEMLIPKMVGFRFGQDSCDLLEDYLTGRQTQVKVKNVLSPPLSLDTGGGEGSLLWPNFFSCGMTDVSVVARQVKHDLMETDKVNVRVKQIEYADD